MTQTTMHEKISFGSDLVKLLETVPVADGVRYLALALIYATRRSGQGKTELMEFMSWMWDEHADKADEV